MSAPSRPNTVSRFLRSPALAALTRASAASSAVLNDCWALATDASANASTAAINAASLARDVAGLVEERMVIMASSGRVSIRHRSSRCRTSTFLWALRSRPKPDATPVRRQSVPDPGDDGREPCARCDPPLVGLQLQAELVIEDHKVAVPTSLDRLRHDRLHLLRHEADIGLVAAVIAEAIEPKPVVEVAEEDDVVLERNIGAPAAASSAAGHARRSSATADALAAAIGLDASLGTCLHIRESAVAPRLARLRLLGCLRTGLLRRLGTGLLRRLGTGLLGGVLARLAAPALVARLRPIAVPRAGPVTVACGGPVTSPRARPIAISRSGRIAITCTRAVTVTRSRSITIACAGPVAVARTRAVAIRLEHLLAVLAAKVLPRRLAGLDVGL